MRVPGLIQDVLFRLVAAAGIVGAVLAGTTRADAFEAANRQPKMVWVAILAFSALALLIPLPFIAWFGAVAVGIYYFDVRPQINDLLRGNYY
ncbi:DUF2516 family protein [Corynebacterium sp. TA-R-1]|uniref:DUF2516 family protein n=1 Tax=Corynebacterium stercoris TaxID=2943490 RepID=A0ABT1G208_9CORY|nr:DUF2516 family protein [Corynebacterium stercoris]MCP1388016.1 DUF2516 family protein [Corynebacterium stercoris]